MKISYAPLQGLVLVFAPDEIKESIAILKHIEEGKMDDETSLAVLHYFTEIIEREPKSLN